MIPYILRRLLLIIPTLLGIILINFFLIQFVPGGPVEQILSEMQGNNNIFENIAGGTENKNDASEEDDYYSTAQVSRMIVKEINSLSPIINQRYSQVGVLID